MAMVHVFFRVVRVKIRFVFAHGYFAPLRLMALGSLLEVLWIFFGMEPGEATLSMAPPLDIWTKPWFFSFFILAIWASVVAGTPPGVVLHISNYHTFCSDCIILL